MGYGFLHGLWIFAFLLQMSRKILKDLEIEEALDEIFGLPENPEESDDDNESEGEEQYSTAKLESILQGLDDEVTIPNNPESAALQDKPQNENCSPCPSISGNTETNPDPQPPVLPRCSGTRPLSPDSSMIDNLSSSSDSDSESDADEMVWKKEKWTSRPEPQFFDEQPISAKRRFTNKTKPIRFLKAFSVIKFTSSLFCKPICMLSSEILKHGLH